MDKRRDPAFRKQNRAGILILCVLGIAVNYAGARAAKALEIPLFLDCIGSALCAALGGYIPGIIVGFFTNLINSTNDISSMYYGSLNVLIAVCSAFFAQRGDYGKLKKLPLIILTFSLIGGGLGSVLTWLIYGFNFGNGISAPLARRIFDSGIMNEFFSQFTADMVIDLADKTVTVLAVALVMRFLPARVGERVELTGWKQAPLSLKERMNESGFAHRRSLRLKIVLLVSLATLVTAGVVTAISYKHYRDASIDQSKELAQDVLLVLTEHVDGDRVDEYLEKEGNVEGYSETKDFFKSMMDSSEYIEFCYAYQIHPDGCHVVIDPDTEDTPGAPIGSVQDFDHAFDPYLPILLEGGDVDVAIMSNETYGWLLTYYKAVRDSSGKTACYAAVDINMQHIHNEGAQFLARVVSLFFGFFIIIMTVTLWLAEYNVILPINGMAVTANRFAFDNAAAREEALDSIKHLQIHTDDEIENLYDAMVKTTEDTLVNIAEMQRQNDTIRKLQNGLIMVLADMVESRDQNTGDHVRKTAAYTGIIMRELLREHIYEDQLTESFMQDVVNSAPLHDVGKIHVPDAILNKPGKLTDEEFEQMKTHTTAGSDIITRAMSTVCDGDSGYLKEARNLAHYHHEKWNGKGYPDGLAGEDIPLSARIMAVADVFDALVSRRSYKNPFTFEKAMDIIREGSGSHFDPNVANAFINASDEVREVMNTHMDQ